MLELTRARTQRLISIHGWSGAILGLMLYVVVLTGAVAVFSHEIGVWSVSGAKVHPPFEQPVDATLRKLATQVDPRYHDEISLHHNAEGLLVAFFHTHAMKDGKPDDLGVRFELHPRSHAVLSQREGYGSELAGAGPKGDPKGALDLFLVDLHVKLTVPDPVGLYLTGILGLMMMMAAVSGLLIHRHILRDLFVAPRTSHRLGNPLLLARDRHTQAASWGLPFAFILAFTGSFMSFAGALGLPALAMVAFKGNQMAMMETILGAPQPTDARSAPLANLDALRADSNARDAALANSLVISHFGRADAQVSILHPPADGRLSGVQHVYDGVSGSYRGIKPFLGTQPSAGNTAIELMGPLHFGNFSGVLSK